jgi:hypothetical protein
MKNPQILISLKQNYAKVCMYGKIIIFILLYCFFASYLYAEYRLAEAFFEVKEISAMAENDLELINYHINRINDSQKYPDGYSRGIYQEYVFFNNGDIPHKVRLGVWYQYPIQMPSELFMINDIKVKHQIVGPEEWQGYFAFIDVVFPARKETKIRVDDLTYINKSGRKFVFNGSPKFTATISNQYMDRFHTYFEIEEYWINDIFFNELGKESLVSIIEQKGTLTNDLFSIRKTNARTWEIEFTKKFVDSHRSDLTFEIEWGVWGYIGGGYMSRSRGIVFNSEERITPYQYIFLTDKQLQVVRNAYYARHGYIFQDQNLGRMMHENFFDPRFGHINYKENPNFKESMLTDIDRANIEIIKRLEMLTEN